MLVRTDVFNPQLQTRIVWPAHFSVARAYIGDLTPRGEEGKWLGVFATADERFELATGGESRPVPGAWVSGAYFSTLGIRPAGGTLTPRRAPS